MKTNIQKFAECRRGDVVIAKHRKSNSLVEFVTQVAKDAGRYFAPKYQMGARWRSALEMDKSWVFVGKVA